MEESNKNEMNEMENSHPRLKRLGFVRVIAINALMCASSLYEQAKQNSGPLKCTVGTVESAVTAVVGPVYEKFKGVPDHLLLFLDEKVDEGAHKFNELAPPPAKHLVYTSQAVVQKASHATQTFVHEFEIHGLSGAVHLAAASSMELFWNISLRFWHLTNKFPPFHVVAEMAIPSVAYWAEKYNTLVADLANKGYTTFRFLPQVPVDEIAKAYKQMEDEKGAAVSPTDPST